MENGRRKSQGGDRDTREIPDRSLRRRSLKLSGDELLSQRWQPGFQGLTIRAVTPDPPSRDHDINSSIYNLAMTSSPTSSPQISPLGPREEKPRAWSHNIISSHPTSSNSRTPSLSVRDSAARPRTRTLDERTRDLSPPATASRTRHRINSVHFTSPSAVREREQDAIHQKGRITSGLTFASVAAGFQPFATSSERKGGEGRHRFMRRSRRPSSPNPHYPSSCDSLPTPIATSDANKILQLMKTLCGRMRGFLDYISGEGAIWHSGYCSIDEDSGSLICDPREPGTRPRTLIPDLRGCHVRTSITAEDATPLLGVSPRSGGMELRLRISDPDEFESWLAAFLCWQPIRPKGAQNKMTKHHNSYSSDRRLGDRRRSDASLSKDSAIIKVGKMMLWDKGISSGPSSPIAWEKSFKDSSQSWRRVSCILQENGEFKLYTELDVSLVAVIQLSQLSRCAIQKLDQSVLDQEFCIAIYPQYTSASTALSLIRPLYLSMESRVLFEVWLVLLRAFTIPELYGPEQIKSDENLTSSQTLRELFATPTTDMFRVERSLYLRIIEAKLKSLGTENVIVEPSSKSRPINIAWDASVGNYHSEVLLDGEVRAKTGLKTNTKNPFWREDYDFSDLPAVISSTAVVLKRRDDDYGPNDKLGHSKHAEPHSNKNKSSGSVSDAVLTPAVTCGIVDIFLDDLPNGKEVEKWWPIVDRTHDTVGELLLKVRADELVVLMSGDYQALSDLLHRFINGLTPVIARYLPTQLRQLSETLLDIFQVSGNASEWLMALVEEEIDATQKDTPTRRFRFGKSRVGSSDSYDSASEREKILRDLGKSANIEANLLFRGNSLLTKALEIHMSRLGREYLLDTLGEKLREIEENDLDCEVDPGRITSLDYLDKNWRNLLLSTEEMWKLISTSASRCPPELRLIFRRVRACAEDRYGDFLRTVTYSSISGFLFLRFFCPAVLNPKLFGLMNDHPRPRAQRTFTLIAKSLQGLANMTSFGVKEPWMVRMNQFLTSNRQSFKEYIENICDISPDSRLFAIPPSYATPITILARLPPTSREGFPSLPYLIDQPRTFSMLVNLWLEHSTEARKSATLEGDILTFHHLCVDLQQRAKDCLLKAEQAERPTSLLSLKWEEMIEQLEHTSSSLDASYNHSSRQGRFEETTTLATIESTPPGSSGSFGGWDMANQQAKKGQDHNYEDSISPLQAIGESLERPISRDSSMHKLSEFVGGFRRDRRKEKSRKGQTEEEPS
ncbi:MAG: hypothetical protein M1829_004381 [Trizodia sp. TS-e1964]|nr:MAG: hypothetical protein M1829_004381 [Trizodia sp. TS-e1964]